MSSNLKKHVASSYQYNPAWETFSFSARKFGLAGLPQRDGVISLLQPEPAQYLFIPWEWGSGFSFLSGPCKMTEIGNSLYPVPNCTLLVQSCSDYTPHICNGLFQSTVRQTLKIGWGKAYIIYKTLMHIRIILYTFIVIFIQAVVTKYNTLGGL